jgi:hypothetical protein
MKTQRSIAAITPLTLCIVQCFAAGSVAAGDLTIVSTVTAARGGPMTTTQYLGDDRMRMADGNNDIVLDLSDGKMIFIDHKKKRYSETTFDEVRQHVARLEEMTAANPMMERMMGSPGEIEIQKTSETRKIAGYGCTKYILSMGDSFRQTAWLTDELDFPVEYYDASKALFAMMGPMATRFEKMVDEMKKIGGFPLATDSKMSFMGRDSSTSSEVIEVRKGAIADDAFSPPAGYKRSKKSPFGD